MDDSSANTAVQEYYSKGLRQRFRLDADRFAPKDNKRIAFADIGYHVDSGKYRARSEAILNSGGLECDVPAGWPGILEGPMIWKGTDWEYEDDYVLTLTEGNKEELLQAMQYFKCSGLAIEEINRDNFPLPSLDKRLAAATEDVYNGRGFVVVRGFDPGSLSFADSTLVYLGISSYIARRRGKQNQQGSIIMHVVEMGQPKTPTNNDRPFHTDTVCDCLALMTYDCCATGGASIIASAWTIYNELAQHRPDIIHVLAEPNWPFDTFGRNPPFYRRALLYYHQGRLILNFSRRLLLGDPPFSPRTYGIPGLTERQAEAIDALHFIAEKYAVRPTMQKGDMRFVNNMGIPHRREAFDIGSERHLVRLWLNSPEKCWELPEPLKLAWARIYDDDERGSSWIIGLQEQSKRGLASQVSCD